MAALAARQYGVVTREQLRRAGVSRSVIDRWVASGRLTTLHRGVYAHGHAVLRTEGFWLAAVLACGPRAALSHRSAAALWDLGDLRVRPVDVTVPAVAPRRPGIAGHEAALAPRDLTVRQGIRVTTPARTLLDLAGVLARDELRRTVEQAMRLRRYDRRALDAAMARAHGRRALKPLRAVLDDLDPVRAPTRSELESRALTLIERADLPAPCVNQRVAGYEVDLHWPAARVVVELDGRTWHATPTAFERDRRRDADLQAAGWRVLRFTWRQVVTEPAWVVARVAAVLADGRRRRARGAASII